MENSILDFSSKSSSVTIFRALLISLFSLLVLYTTRVAIKAIQGSKDQRSPMVAFISFCLSFFSLCNFHSATIFHLLNTYLNYPRPLHLVFIYIPCTIFTIIVSRFSFLLFDIYLTFKQESTPETKERTLEVFRYSLFMYVSLDFTSRLVISCLGNQSWMFLGSALQTIMLLTLIFSATSLILILLIILVVYFRVKSALKSSMGEEVNRNLRSYAFSFTFMVFCFWMSFVIGSLFFGITEIIE